ncbi:MAG: hypothetical protein HKN32_07350, partial [Flavobacteriales bacterium]|nr:hypothetical protein [Flavobacteriales bacterium]
MLRDALLTFLCLLCSLAILAQDFSLHINKSLTEFIEMEVVFCAFNDSPTFDSKNSIIEVDPGTYSFEVFNHDTLEHTFSIDGLLENENVILAGDSATFNVTFSDLGTVRYFSEKPYGEGLGAAGQILVGYGEYDCYYW